MSDAAEKDRAERVITVTRDQLPLSCPQAADEVWNMHPRVYLPIEKTGQAACPYCGTKYILGD